MFRTRKESGNAGSPRGSESETRSVEPDPAGLKIPVRKSVPIPARSVAGASYPLDIPRRPADPPGFYSKRAEPHGAGGEDNKRLIVGRGIRIEGEISSCDQMIVEGHVRVSLGNLRQMQIGSTGLFEGKAEVAEADISGRFDGELIARERLTVRSTGRVSGKIRYGHIVIEAGGEIIGDVAALGSESSPVEDAGSQTKPAFEPSAGKRVESGASSVVVAPGAAEVVRIQD